MKTKEIEQLLAEGLKTLEQKTWFDVKERTAQIKASNIDDLNEADKWLFEYEGEDLAYSELWEVEKRMGISRNGYKIEFLNIDFLQGWYEVKFSDEDPTIKEVRKFPGSFALLPFNKISDLQRMCKGCTKDTRSKKGCTKNTRSKK